MVTDFINEYNGYLRLNEDELRRARLVDPTIPSMAREVMLFGVQGEGYFTAEKFCLQVAKAAQIASFTVNSLLMTIM